MMSLGPSLRWVSEEEEMNDPMDVEHVYVDCPQCDSEIISWQAGEPGEQVQVYCENCQEMIMAAVKGEE